MITPEILEAIKKSIPEHQAEILRNIIKEGEKDKEAISQYKIEIKGLTDLCESRDRKIKELEITLARAGNLDKRESDLRQKEKQINDDRRKLDINELKYKLDTEKEKSDFCKSVALSLVRNTEYRSTVFKNNSENPHNSNNYLPIIKTESTDIENKAS